MKHNFRVAVIGSMLPIASLYSISQRVVLSTCHSYFYLESKFLFDPHKRSILSELSTTMAMAPTLEDFSDAYKVLPAFLIVDPYNQRHCSMAI